MSDSDDDLPIMDLIRKRKAKELAAQNATSSSSKDKSKSEPVKKAKVATETKTSQPSSRSNNNNTISGQFYDTQKGFLAQKFLVRWWYAMEWPKAEEIGEPPVGYEALDGFKGVFISTRTDSLGKILDLRNKETCPSLRNIAKFNSTKIKQLCVTAYEKQMEQLSEHEGKEGPLYATLKSELAEVKRVDCDKADKEAKKFYN